MSLNTGESGLLISIVAPVFDAAEHARTFVEAFARQSLPGKVELILVDDGSQTPLSIAFEGNDGLDFSIVRLPHNQGRAAARNAGIAASSAPYVAFMDIDCIPQTDFLEHLAAQIATGADLVFGHVEFRSGDNYFDAYENRVQQSRQSDLGNWQLRMTSANFAVRRDVLTAVGGFDSSYRQYGLEDRDLFIRIRQSFPDLQPVYRKDCSVTHVDRPLLDDVLRKFEAMGQHAAPLFRRNHPREYAAMPLHYFDARFLDAYRVLPKAVLSRLALSAHSTSNWVFALALKWRWQGVANTSLRLLKGLTFLRGTLLDEATND